MTRKSVVFLFSTWMFVAGAPAAIAQTGAGDAAAVGEASDHDEQVMGIARRMADAIAGAEQISATIEIAYDAVQPDGETIEFGATRTIALRRPDRVRVDVVDRGGAGRKLVYDGAQISLADDTRDVYATLAHRGDIDSMLAYVQDELQLPTPLAEFLSRDLYEQLAASESAQWVDEQVIDGVRCDHLAFRNAETGLQLWVPTDGEPLPRRIVVNYERADGRPGFRANVRDWNLSAHFDDSHFAFSPDEGAERIQFRAGAAIVPGAAVVGGSE